MPLLRHFTRVKSASEVLASPAAEPIRIVPRTGRAGTRNAETLAPMETLPAASTLCARCRSTGQCACAPTDSEANPADLASRTNATGTKTAREVNSAVRIRLARILASKSARAA